MQMETENQKVHKPDRVRLHVIDDEIVKEHEKPLAERSDARLRTLNGLLIDELEGYEIEAPSYISLQEFNEILDIIEVETSRRKQRASQ